MKLTLPASRLVAATTVSVLLMSMAVARLSRGSSNGTFWQLQGVVVLENAQNCDALHAGVQVGASGSHNTGAPDELLAPPWLDPGALLESTAPLEPACEEPGWDVAPLTPEEPPPPEDTSPDDDEEEEDDEEDVLLEVSSPPLLLVQATLAAVANSMVKVHGACVFMVELLK